MNETIKAPTIADEASEQLLFAGFQCGYLRGKLADLDLCADDFSNGANAALWRVCLSLDAQGIGYNFITAKAEAVRLDLLGEAGMDFAYLVEMGKLAGTHTLTESTVSSAVNRLKAQRQARQGAAIMVRALNRLAGSEGLLAGGIIALLDGARADLELVGRGVDELGTYDAHDMLAAAYDILDRDPNAPFHGVALGIPSVDSRLGGGIANGELCVIMARPGHGKTALLINSLAALVQAGGNAGLVSLEMTMPEITRRVIACAAPARMSSLKLGDMTPEAREATRARAMAIFERKAAIKTNRDNLTIGQIERQARRWHRSSGSIHALFVDYAQIVRLDAGRRMDGKAAVVDEVINRLKALALELNIPVIVAAQARRSVDDNAEGLYLPGMGDGADCSTIEKAANVIVGLSRPHRYDAANYSPDQAWANIAKQRDGQDGAIAIGWTGSNVLFHELAEEEYQTCSERSEERWMAANDG